MARIALSGAGVYGIGVAFRFYFMGGGGNAVGVMSRAFSVP
jgi:hypothetical protein